jgi:glycosyltransferase involved in cell wall biosynthesis
MYDVSSVTVVIPTIGRSHLRRALRSVRSQTHNAFSIVVVLDDPKQESEVRSIVGDASLVVTSGRTGAATARNLGSIGATTRYVAFLDDDDWWEPTKLERQIEQLKRTGGQLAYTQTIFHEAGGTLRVLPRRRMAKGELVADYLVTRPSLKHGEGYIQTSSLLVDTEVLREVRWDASLPKHQDWDIIIRLADSGLSFTYVEEPLVHVQQGSAGSISKTHDWRASLGWLERHHDRFSSAGRADFIATHVLRAAAAEMDVQGLVAARRHLLRGRPHVAALAVGLHGFVEGRK